MQRRGQRRIDERMTTRTFGLVLALVLALLSLSCGGSGSSGFDVAENTAIEMALDEQRCVESEGLTICPATTPPHGSPDATRTRTATPLPVVPTPTPTMTEVDSPTGTPSAGPVQETPTVAPSPTSTPRPSSTPTVDSRMAVDTSFDGSESTACIPTSTPGVCVLPFIFMPQGFSIDSEYQVAVRSTADEPWELLEALQISFDAQAFIFEANIPINTLAQGPTAGVDIQTAVLVFVDRPPLLPASEIIESLAESGADFAYVSPLETIEIRTGD